MCHCIHEWGEVHYYPCCDTTCERAVKVHPELYLRISFNEGFPKHCYGSASTAMEEDGLRHRTKHSDPPLPWTRASASLFNVQAKMQILAFRERTLISCSRPVSVTKPLQPLPLQQMLSLQLLSLYLTDYLTLSEAAVKSKTERRTLGSQQPSEERSPGILK